MERVPKRERLKRDGMNSLMTLRSSRFSSFLTLLEGFDGEKRKWEKKLRGASEVTVGMSPGMPVLLKLL